MLEQHAEHVQVQARAEARGAAAEAQVVALTLRVTELEAAFGLGEGFSGGAGGSGGGLSHTDQQGQRRRSGTDCLSIHPVGHQLYSLGHPHAGARLKAPRRVGAEEPSPNCVLSGPVTAAKSSRDRPVAASPPPPPHSLDSTGSSRTCSAAGGSRGDSRGGSRASSRLDGACAFSRTFATEHTVHLARGSTAESAA